MRIIHSITRNLSQSSFLWLFLAIVFVVLSTSYISSYEIRSERQRDISITRQVKSLKESIILAQSEHSYLTAPGRIKALAGELLDLKPLTREQIKTDGLSSSLRQSKLEFSSPKLPVRVGENDKAMLVYFRLPERTTNDQKTIYYVLNILGDARLTTAEELGILDAEKLQNIPTVLGSPTLDDLLILVNAIELGGVLSRHVSAYSYIGGETWAISLSSLADDVVILIGGDDLELSVKNFERYYTKYDLSKLLYKKFVFATRFGFYAQ